MILYIINNGMIPSSENMPINVKVATGVAIAIILFVSMVAGIVAIAMGMIWGIALIISPVLMAGIPTFLICMGLREMNVSEPEPMKARFNDGLTQIFREAGDPCYYVPLTGTKY